MLFPVSATFLLLAASADAAVVSIDGRVVDLNGRPVPAAQVIFDRDEAAPGASVVTVFTDADGSFRFPGSYDADTVDPETINPMSVLRS